ncbi:hypothetical protein QYE76_013451 [Lolium multiflorum]|uniref:Protein FAR1-RELATED SEQUENCE n=1 Tax=Lolium multiflorum TaxID=4521 RepID=A0AAD8X7M4_LOLMU|nr:hypothetical protein QYE76_013451 [Lolium multiflorum]
MPTTTISGSSNPDLVDHGADGVAPNEEVASSPQEPFLGMRFDTIEDAREHYNAYSKRLGFSIKSNTSKRQPFTKSTQRSEGFNIVLKRYINPHNSIKHFVKQYEKLQQRILGKEGHNDFRTDELEPDPWSSFPIDKHALAVYTRPIYHRFRLEFALIGCYNVQPQGNNFYQLVPNNEKCYPYGARYYMVNANGGQFNYECCKFERDGLLCCHVLKVFTHIGVDAIPEQYILRRWTPGALETVVQPTVPAKDDVMPEESRQKLRMLFAGTIFIVTVLIAFIILIIIVITIGIVVLIIRIVIIVLINNYTSFRPLPLPNSTTNTFCALFCLFKVPYLFYESAQPVGDIGA